MDELFEVGEGYIKLYRRIRRSDVWANHDLFRFWIWCLLKASHSAVTKIVGYQAVALQPGQFIFGRRMAHEETGLSERTIRTCVTALKSGDDPRIDLKTTKAYSIITIRNWRKYQKSTIPNDQQTTSETTNRRPTSDQQATTNKNDQETIPPPAPARDGERGEEPDTGEPEGEQEPLRKNPPEAPASLLEAATAITLTPDGPLKLLRMDYSDDWIVAAIKGAVLSGKRNWHYVRGTLQGYQREGGPEENDCTGQENGRRSAKRGRSQSRLDQHSIGDVLEARRRGRAEAEGMGNEDDGFDWGAG